MTNSNMTNMSPDTLRHWMNRLKSRLPLMMSSQAASLGLAMADRYGWRPFFYHGSGDHLFETPISTDQALVELGDGRLRLKATVADAQQLIWWLLGLGDGVEVVKPSELRRKMAQATEKMAQLYRQAW